MRANLTTYPAMPAYSLPYGTLHLDIDHADLPPDDRPRQPAPRLPLRQQSAGQTHPVPTETLARVHRLLAAKLPADLPAPVLFIGMTETATALAQGAFETWLAAHPPRPHSTCTPAACASKAPTSAPSQKATATPHSNGCTCSAGRSTSCARAVFAPPDGQDGLQRLCLCCFFHSA